MKLYPQLLLIIFAVKKKKMLAKIKMQLGLKVELSLGAQINVLYSTEETNINFELELYH